MCAKRTVKLLFLDNIFKKYIKKGFFDKKIGKNSYCMTPGLLELLFGALIFSVIYRYRIKSWNYITNKNNM